MIAPKDHTPIEEAMSIYNDDGVWIGHTTSFMFLTIFKKHIAMVKVEPAMAALGTEVLVELMVNNRPRAVRAKVVKMPFFNPARKTEHI